jgi:hypothetical protein
MGQKWRVWNKHPEGLTHTEKFREETVSIPAGSYILMEYEDAVQFRGQFFPMLRDAQGAPDPKGFKCIQLEKHPEESEETIMPVEFICHNDGAKFPTQALLDSYVKQNYSENAFTDEAIEDEIKRQAKAKKAGAQRTTKEKSA